MSDGTPLAHTSEDSQQFVLLANRAHLAENPEEFLESAVPVVAGLCRATAAFLYVMDPRQSEPIFFHYRLQPTAVAPSHRLSTDLFAQMVRQADWQPFYVTAAAERGVPEDLALFPVRSEQGCVGLLGLAGREVTTEPLDERMVGLLRWLANATCRLLERVDYERQLAHLNTYLTVSSMLAQPLDLHELLEAVLYCCMDAVAAESASVLLLDDGQESFSFYHVEGPAKPVLMQAGFPASTGVAGAVLHSQRSEIVQDVQRDPRFYSGVDARTGFQTRNMIALPLTAGEERVGVLELLNKADGGQFDEDEHHLLVSVAEEIAFAVRNAKVFEYVVNTYCKQRQGQRSCHGCVRPLGSWTPCVKYREVSL